MIDPVKDMVPRGNDPTGYGHYGARRGTRKHKGFDIKASVLDSVFAPISGYVTKVGQVYRSTAEFRYIEISNDIYRVRLMYVLPNQGVEVNDRVIAGDKIGLVQDVSGYWSSKMINHIHIEVYKYGLLTDPEPLFI